MKPNHCKEIELMNDKSHFRIGVPKDMEDPVQDLALFRKILNAPRCVEKNQKCMDKPIYFNGNLLFLDIMRSLDYKTITLNLF